MTNFWSESISDQDLIRIVRLRYAALDLQQHCSPTPVSPSPHLTLVGDGIDQITLEEEEKTMESLPSLVFKRFEEGVSNGSINVYPSTSIEPFLLPSSSLQFCLHLVPSLSEKPPASASLPDLITQPPPGKDPLASPCPKEEFIACLREYEVKLNLYPILEAQFMIATRGWKIQNERMDEQDLWYAWKMCEAFEKEGKGLLGFYNCGNRSAASQPHRHVQFIHLPPGKTSPVEDLALSITQPTSGSPPSPSTYPLLLPLPHQHFITPLSASSSMTASSLHALYLSSLSRHPTTLNSHNVLLTTRHLHTIPRSKRDVMIPRKDGREWRFGPNGLGFAGWLFVGEEEERKAYFDDARGVEEALVGVGVKNEQFGKREGEGEGEGQK